MPDDNVQYTRRLYLGGWVVFQSDDGEFLFLERAGKPGRMKITATEEGVLAQLLVQGDDDLVAGSMCGMWSDLQPLKVKRKMQSFE